MTLDQEQLIKLSALVGAATDFLQNMEMDDDSANEFRDELYAYLNPMELILTLIARNLPNEESNAQPSSQVATGLPASTSLEGCPFHYCDSVPVCEGRCRYNRK